MTPNLPPPAPEPDRTGVDGLPEETPYQDTGCDVFDRAQYPSCLACPLPACVHDGRDSRSLETQRRQRRRWVEELWAHGCTVPQIAQTLGISDRTVQRDLRAGQRALARKTAPDRGQR